MPRVGDVERVFGRQAVRARKPWHHAQPAPTRALRDQRVTVVKQADIAAELVDQKAADHRGILGIQHPLGSHDLRDDPAPVDIAHQHNRHPRRAGKAHIGNVIGAQVDLCRAAGTFDQHDIAGRGQAMETVQHRGHELRLDRGIVAGPGAAPAPALHNDLRPCL